MMAETAFDLQEISVSHCVTVWEEVAETNGSRRQRPLIQGCWLGQHNPGCEERHCRASRPFPPDHRNHTFMCCCTG